MERAITVPLNWRRGLDGISWPPLSKVCARTNRSTYEKSDPACGSRMVLLRGVQAALVNASGSLCFSSDLFLHVSWLA
jgi:hypothetical protein